MSETAILVPGIGFGGLEMMPLAVRLRRRGYRAAILRHCPWRHSLAHKAAQLRGMVCAPDADVIHLIGHSTGGVIILRMFQDYPEQPPGRIVMLGVPINGCLAAQRVARLPFGRRLLGQCLFSANADAPHRLPPGRDVGGVAGKVNLILGWMLRLARPNDTVISVQEALHSDMRDTAVLAVTHGSMLLSRQVADCVDCFLKTGDFGESDSGGKSPIENPKSKIRTPSSHSHPFR